EGAEPGTHFVSREPTGRTWRGEATSEDLILTRIVRLEGLEPGVNQGAGHDSLERYIYVHGTNHESAIGIPASHGCIRMRNADVIALFERVRTGDSLVVMGESESRTAADRLALGGAADAPAQPAIPDPRTAGRFHYAGLGGSGMSALAQFQVMLG